LKPSAWGGAEIDDLPAMFDESVAPVGLEELEASSAPVAFLLGKPIELISATFLEPSSGQDYLPEADPLTEARIHWLILSHFAGFSAPSCEHLASISQKEQGTSMIESMLEYLRLANTR
jgi:hypothetical protein